MGEMRSAYRTLSENLKGKEHSVDGGVDEKIILEWVLWK
jgi:hypothetical protein